jgi:crotonobetainyl-CoA:carnitine CoA-transferase CaiB-like acyl-CoA transferase
VGVAFAKVRVLLVASGGPAFDVARRMMDQGAAVVVRSLDPETGVDDQTVALVDETDVFITDVVAADRGRLAAAERRAANPALIYCAITPYGDHGPLAALPGGEVTAQAVTGVLRLDAGDGPVRAPRLALAAELAAAGALAEIAGALFGRTTSGEGAYLDVAFVDALATLVGAGRDPVPAGGFGGVFATGDGRAVAVEVADTQWTSACDALGLFDLRALTRFERMARMTELQSRFGTTIGRETCATILGHLLGAGIAATPAVTPTEMTSVPHLQLRGLLASAESKRTTFLRSGFPDRDADAPQ